MDCILRRRRSRFSPVTGMCPSRRPSCEQTELFVRGIGEATDVVSKEMFTAISGENLKRRWVDEREGHRRAKSRLSLAPRGHGRCGARRSAARLRARRARAPAKLMYAGPMFRARAPAEGTSAPVQSGGCGVPGRRGAYDRCRGHHHAHALLRDRWASRAIPCAFSSNSMGCEQCRPAYRELVRAYMDEHADELCDTCMTRAEVNPLRAFDCKNPQCCGSCMAERAEDHRPSCATECREHYDAVKALSRWLPGLSTRRTTSSCAAWITTPARCSRCRWTTAWEAQNAIGGGGRYDKLAEEVGGRPDAGPWASRLAIERCVLALEAAGVEFPAGPEVRPVRRLRRRFRARPRPSRSCRNVATPGSHDRDGSPEALA